MTSLEVALRLLSMEVGVIVLVGLLGSGLAVLLPGDVPAAARVALAPGIGLAVGFPVLLTASQFMPMSVGAWAVLAPLTVASTVFAAVRAWRGRRSRAGPRSHLVCLAVAVAVPMALFSAPLIEQRSLGPVAYQVTDASTYAAFNGHLEDNSWRDEHFGLGRADDRLANRFLASSIFQSSGTFPLGAAANAVFGWRSIDAQSALMIALVAIGALGCFAIVLTASGSAWAGVAAAALFAGPVNYQLFIDGSESALAGLAMFGPLAVVGREVLRAPARAGALLGLLVGGVMTVYPALLPVVGVVFALAMAIHLIRHRRRPPVRRVALAAAAAVLAVVVIAPVSLAKNVAYVGAVSRGQLEEPADEAFWEEPVVFANFGERTQPPPLQETFPEFLPPVETAPAWIAQSRERYDLIPVAEMSALEAATLVLVLPALLVSLVAVGALRYRDWAFLLLAVGAALALAAYAYLGQDCSYCGQRALLAIPPVVIVLACCGLVAVAGWIAARTELRWAGPAAAAAAALALTGAALANDRALAERLLDGGYLLRDEAREVLDEASGEVLVEGAGVGNPYTAYFESDLLPQTVRDATGEVPLLDRNGLAIATFPEQFPPGIPGNPDYRLVFTRLADVESDRRVLIQRGPYALEERVALLDATIVNGVVADLVQRDPAGSAWVTGPVTVLVAASGSDAGPAFVVLELSGPEAATLRLDGPGAVVHEDGRALVCVPAPGRDPMRRVTVPLRFEESQYVVAPDPTDPGIPGMALKLEALSAARQCPPVFSARARGQGSA